MLFIKAFKDGLKSSKTLYFYIVLLKFVGVIFFFISFFSSKDCLKVCFSSNSVIYFSNFMFGVGNRLCIKQVHQYGAVASSGSFCISAEYNFYYTGLLLHQREWIWSQLGCWVWKFPCTVFKCFLTICGLFRELVFVHCTMFQRSAVKVAPVPAGPSLLPGPASAGRASGSSVLVLCGMCSNTSCRVCSVSG